MKKFFKNFDGEPGAVIAVVLVAMLIVVLAVTRCTNGQADQSPPVPIFPDACVLMNESSAYNYKTSIYKCSLGKLTCMMSVNEYRGSTSLNCSSLEDWKKY